MSSPSPRSTRSTGFRLLMILLVVGVSVGGWIYYQHARAQTLAAKAAVDSLRPSKRVQVHSLGRLEPTGTILQLSPSSGNEGAVIETAVGQRKATTWTPARRWPYSTISARRRGGTGGSPGSTGRRRSSPAANQGRRETRRHRSPAGGRQHG
jgi:hypothetical protein